MKNPLVSVIMPVHNGAPFLEEAIENVFANGYAPIELLIVNDGSTDRTAEILRGTPHAIHTLEQPNKGPAAARNAALSQATGYYVSFLDVDDRWPEGRLAQHVALLETNPEVDIVQGRICKRRLVQRANGEAREIRLVRPYVFVNLGSATYRRELFSRVGLFDETMRFNEDTDWWFRAWEAGVVKRLAPEVALHYRIHRTNMTHEFQEIPGQGLPRLFQRHLRRTREGQHTHGGNMASLAEYVGWTDMSAAHREGLSE